jgi:hypothetical protein
VVSAVCNCLEKLEEEMMKTTLCTLVLGLGVCAAHATNIYVSPTGSDANSGNSRNTPMATINQALQLAQPGDKVVLLSGVYLQDVATVRSGTEAAPIQIVGAVTPSFADASGQVDPIVIQGSGSSDRMFQIRHSYIQLRDVTLDGLVGDPSVIDSYREKLLFVHNDTDPAGIKGISIRRVNFRNSGGECMRFRYFVQSSEVAYSTFENCGVHDFKFKAGKKNGEAIYIGTSFNQWADGKNPTAEPDQSSNNRIHHNTFNTQGNECVDIKEGSTNNRVYANNCTGQRDPNSAGFNSAGNGNLFYDNTVYGNTGSGFRFGSDMDGYGIGNQAWGNDVADNHAIGFNIQDGPQKKLCGNTVKGNLRGTLYAVSSAGSYTPTVACP